MINYSIAIMSTTPGTKKAQITETKAYGVAQMLRKVSFDEFCEHIAEHNSPFSKGTVQGILTDAVSCIREMLLDGKKVALGDLGDFHVELKTEGARTTEEFSAANIKAVNVRFTPGTRFENLRSESTFQLVPNRSAQADAIEGIKNEDTIQGLESPGYNGEP